MCSGQVTLGLERKSHCDYVIVKKQSQGVIVKLLHQLWADLPVAAAAGRWPTSRKHGNKGDKTMLLHLKTEEGNSQDQLPQSFAHPSEMGPDHAANMQLYFLFIRNHSNCIICILGY